MIVRLRELRSNEAICRYDNIKKKEDDPMSSLKDKTVTMAHGAGGRQTSELIDQIFAAHFANPDLTADDAAVLTPPAGKMAVSTDGFIVSPAFFPGGNIGKLSICGTVNDLACMGAKPLYLTCAFVIEEGFPMEKLEEIGVSMVDFHRLSIEESAYLEVFFDSEILPLLSPTIVGKRQPFPFLKNREIYAVCVLQTKSGKEKLGIVPLSLIHI